MKKLFFAGLLCLNILPVQAVFQDTPLLIQLVTTTASQLNELEKLVTNAEKYTKRMQEYNELMMDEYFRAQRILAIAESQATRKEINDLEGLNSAIRELKYNLQDMEGLVYEYRKMQTDEKITQEKVKVKLRQNDKDEQFAKKQVDRAIAAKTSGRAEQLTAQNTALILENDVKKEETQLEILKNVSTTKRLMAEELEEKRLAQIQKQRAYFSEMRMNKGDK